MKAGPRFEAAVVAYLREHGFPHAERRVMGGSRDRGDVAGVPDFAIEVKNTAAIDLAGACTEAAREAGHAAVPHWAVVQKRRHRPVGEAYVVMALAQFASIAARVVNPAQPTNLSASPANQPSPEIPTWPMAPTTPRPA